MSDKISSTQKAILILKTLAREPYNYTALELSKELNLHRSTVHRILNDFIAEKFVNQNKYTKKYKLGPGIFNIGSSYLYSKGLNKDILNIIDSVAEKTKESVGFYVKDDNVIISVYEAESFQVNKLGDKPGCVYPINAGASGKCIAAFSDPEEIEVILQTKTLTKFTANTIMDHDMLRKEYAKIRSQGYSISNGERIEGRFGIGAPIINARDKVFGCIAVACFKTGMTEEKTEFMKKVVVESAKEISALIP